MERAAGFYPVGWGFESLRGHQRRTGGRALLLLGAALGVALVPWFGPAGPAAAHDDTAVIVVRSRKT